MMTILRRAMQDSDSYVVSLDYTDQEGVKRHRVVSPIRFIGTNRFLALCLCRGEPRQFRMDRIDRLELRPAEQVLMPEPITELDK